MGKIIRRMSAIAMALIMICIAVLLYYTPVKAEDGYVDVWIEVEYQQDSARSMLNYINLFRTGQDVNDQRPDYWNSDNQTKTTMADLHELTYDYSLERTAMLRAAEIAIYFEHSRPNGDTGPFNAWEGPWNKQGENLAASYGYSGNQALLAFQQLREDKENYAGQGHRRNMLSRDYTKVGIGHVYYNGVHYWTQAFGTGTGDDINPGAVNGKQLVKITVKENEFTQKSVSSSPQSISLENGGRAELPDVPVSFLLKETWPDDEVVSGFVKPSWTSSDTSIAIIEGTDIVGVSAGETTLTATVFGQEISVPVTVTPATPEFTGHRLVLSGEIGVQFAMDLSCLSAEERGASFMNFVIGTTSEPVIVNTSALTEENGKYFFTCYVNSLQMADAITATFHYGDGQTIENVYSVKDYIDYIVAAPENSFDTSTVALAKAIADYGHYAQIYLKGVHDFTVGANGKYQTIEAFTDQLDLSSAAKAVEQYKAELSNLSNDKVEKLQLKLSLDSETALSIRAVPKEGVTSITGTASFHEGEYPFDSNIAKITGIKAAWLTDRASLTGDVQGNASALSYAHAVLNGNSTNADQKNAVAALYYYYVAAKNYTDAHSVTP